MPLVIFGIIAVIGLSFLMIFNVRSSKKKREAKEPEQTKQVEATSEENIIASPAPSNLESISIEKQQPKMSVTHDSDYRQALRSFADEQPKTKAEEIPNMPHTPDQDYREALRSMRGDE